MTEKILGLKGALDEATQFATWESKVQSMVGLTKDEIRAIRKKSLVQGVHWISHKKRTCYSLAGIHELQRILKIPHTQKDAAASPGAIAEHCEPTPAEVITLKVFRTGFHSGRIIEAYPPEKDPANIANRVRVRVRSDKNFTRGMEIPVTELQVGLYELARPCPRTKGKW